MLSSAHPPYDKRVFAKEAVSLAGAGFDVCHIAPDVAGGDCRKDGVRILTYARPPGWRARLLQLPHLLRLAVQQKADCYHCNELDSWWLGILLKLLRGSRVVFDVHEHYPSGFAEQFFPPRLRPIGELLMRLLYLTLSPLTDRLVFAKKFLESDFPGSSSKGVLVENFAPLDYRDLVADHPRLETPAASGGLTAIHIGLMARTRCWPQLLDALASEHSRGFRVILIGKFVDGSEEEFRKHVARQGLADRVIVKTWMPYDEVYREVLRADVGLVLLQPGIMNHTLALPHKMFDYMVAGLPIIAPRFAVEVAEIVREADCGILVDTARPEELADALKDLAADHERRRRLGENGRHAVLTKFNWEREAQKLIQMYRELQDINGQNAGAGTASQR